MRLIFLKNIHFYFILFQFKGKTRYVHLYAFSASLCIASSLLADVSDVEDVVASDQQLTEWRRRGVGFAQFLGAGELRWTGMRR